ncbi:MAG TPA: MFS transporter, partial [Candidatus Limnocylindrales bacterium]
MPPAPAVRTVAHPVSAAVVIGLFLGAIALRPQLLAIGPLLPEIREDLGLRASIAGLITTIPVLCMGLFAPVGPRIAARIGPRLALATSIASIAGFGVVRAAAPDVVPLLLATFGIGVGVGIAGAVPSMVVSQHLPGHRAMGTGAYAGGIVAGSAIAAAIAVPLAANDDWRRALAILSIASLGPLVAWLLLIRTDGTSRPV